jgi:Holliday junction resolvasome RuvABC endonuclease subunit
MTNPTERHFVFAVYPTSRGFAFALFEGEGILFDWGTTEIREKKKNARTLERIRRLIERYEPEVMVIEAITNRSRRSDRILRLYKMLLQYAGTKGLDVRSYSRIEVRECFVAVGAKTKYEIAKAIAIQIPELAHRLPPVRKLWMSEDARQSLFDAAALGIAHYARERALMR